MYRCKTCGHEDTAWARIERHVDTEHGAGRIEIILEDKRDKQARVESPRQGSDKRSERPTPTPRSG